eukprot:INCI19848.1.p1 GENE.INCI19848.1~~INCI19848.1.p1  ORF type:complete len:345 (-),score=80.06 INCI19848.1:263-1297(-)
MPPPQKKVWVNHYEVMGVTAAVTARELVKAYRDLSLKLHPDKNPDDPDAASKFHAMKMSYEVLKDQSKKAEFDSQVKAKEIQFARDMAKSEKTRNMKKALEAAEKAAEDRARLAALGKQQRQSSAQMATAKLARLRADGQRLKQKLEDESVAAARAYVKQRAVDAGILSPSAITPPVDRQYAGSSAGSSANPVSDGEVTGVTVKFKHRDQLSEGALRAKILEATSGVKGVIVKLAQSTRKKRKIHVFLDSTQAARRLIQRGIPGVPSIALEFTDKAHREGAGKEQGDAPSKRQRPLAPTEVANAATKRPREAAATEAGAGPPVQGDLMTMEEDIFAQMRKQFQT